jgi:hypothetical protein
MEIKVARIVYELFESDAVWLDKNPLAEVHELDREIRLEGESGGEIYISWCTDPVQYAIGISNKSFFSPLAPVVRDMTDSVMWSGIAGQTVTLRFLDDHHQVLEIRSESGIIYCWTSEFEMAGLDVVNVSKHKPG